MRKNPITNRSVVSNNPHVQYKTVVATSFVEGLIKHDAGSQLSFQIFFLLFFLLPNEDEPYYTSLSL